jgi:hypothetical protein
MTNGRNRNHRLTNLWPGLAVAALALLTSTASADEIGHCYTADVPFEIVLPDGTAHGPALLTICVTRRGGPVARYLKISVNRRAVGEYPARIAQAEDWPVDRDVVFAFRPNGHGQLVLEGCAFPSPDGTPTYDLRWRHRIEKTFPTDLVNAIGIEEWKAQEKVKILVISWGRGR